jgi:predicted transcriptional regulator
MIERGSNIQIIADTLRLDQAGKTQIMHSANTSYSQQQKYLDFLTENGYMERVSSEASIATYRTTTSGLTNLAKGVKT